MARVAMSDPSLDKQCEGSDQSKISKRVAGNAVFHNKSAWTWYSEKYNRNAINNINPDLILKVSDYQINS